MYEEKSLTFTEERENSVKVELVDNKRERRTKSANLRRCDGNQGLFAVVVGGATSLMVVSNKTFPPLKGKFCLRMFAVAYSTRDPGFSLGGGIFARLASSVLFPFEWCSIEW